MTHNPKCTEGRKWDDAEIWMFLEELIYCCSPRVRLQQFFIVANINNSGTGLIFTTCRRTAGILEVSEIPEGHVKDAFHLDRDVIVQQN